MMSSVFSFDNCDDCDKFDLRAPERMIEVTQTLKVQPTPQNSLWTVCNLLLSGIPDRAKKDEVVLYLRPATQQMLQVVNRSSAEFLEFLRGESDRQPCVDVFGHSGNGKSTELFAVFQRFESENKLWVTASGYKGHFQVLLFRKGRRPLSATISYLKLFELVKTFPESSKSAVSLVVFDGALVVDGRPFYPLDEFYRFIEKQRLFVIRCTSGWASMVKRINLRVYRVQVPGFQLSEYFDAKEALKEKNSVLHKRKKSDLSKWYYVVGGHARYFFRYESLEEARRTMMIHVEDVPVPEQMLLVEGPKISGARTLPSHNLLGYTLSAGELKPCVVSQFVLHCFIHNIQNENEKLQLIQRAQALMVDNGSYQGWMFEAMVVTLMEIASNSKKQFQLISELGLLIIDAPLSNVIHYDEPNELVKYGCSGDRTVWQAYVPRAWYHHGFDAIIIKFNGKRVTVYVLQCTVAKTHTCKLKNVDIFLKSLFCKRSGDGPDMWLPRPVESVSLVPAGVIPSSSSSLVTTLLAPVSTPFTSTDIESGELRISEERKEGLPMTVRAMEDHKEQDFTEHLTKEEQAEEDYQQFELPSGYEEDSEPEMPTDKKVVAPTFYEKFSRGCAVRTRKAYRRMVRVPENEWFPGVHMTIHYCAVVPKTVLSLYNHTSPTNEDVELLQKHDKDFEYSRSFHRVTLKR